MHSLSRNVLLVDASNKRQNAGPKARLDTAMFLAQLGFTLVTVPHSRSRHWRKLIALYLKIIWRCNFPENSIIWCQFPLESTTKVVLQKAQQQGLKTVVFIHDIEGLKRESPDWPSVHRELDDLRQYSHVLSLNSKISSILQSHGIVADAELECWDYHCDATDSGTANPGDQIKVIYAGNLSSYKSGFIYQLDRIKSVGFELFGQGIDGDVTLPGNVRYAGAFNPDTPPAWLGNYFGLVWDGTSMDTCKGDYGAYLAFNTPHKAALYLCRNIPLIVWRGACIAPLIHAHHAGLLVSSLSELENVLAALTHEQYQNLKRGATALGEKVRSGYFIKKAARKIVNKTASD